MLWRRRAAQRVAADVLELPAHGVVQRVRARVAPVAVEVEIVGRRARTGELEQGAGGLHRDAIRIPMMIVAVVGSLINLYVIWRIRSLRKRPSAQWRQQVIPRKKIWSENAQVAMAVVTLVLVAAELFSHLYIFRFVN